MEFTDKEKLLMHASWIMAVVPMYGMPMAKAYKTIEAIRNNKCRKVTQEESKEITDAITEEFKVIAEFLDLLRNGDIPDESGK